MKTKNYSFLPFFIDTQIFIPPQKQVQKPLKYYGENKKNILILLEDKATDFMKSESYSFLTDIMRAVKFSSHEVAIVNLGENETANWNMFKQQFLPSVVLIFCETDLPVPNYYEIVSYQESRLLKAHPLPILRSDKSKKTALWKNMQILFADRID